MRKVTLPMYQRALKEAAKITANGGSILGSTQDHKLYEKIHADGERIGTKYTQPSLTYRQGLEIGFLLGIDAANPAATFVPPSVAPKKK